jgi:hypothetical protein
MQSVQALTQPIFSVLFVSVSIAFKAFALPVLFYKCGRDWYVCILGDWSTRRISKFPTSLLSITIPTSLEANFAWKQTTPEQHCSRTAPSHLHRHIAAPSVSRYSTAAQYLSHRAAIHYPLPATH